MLSLTTILKNRASDHWLLLKKLLEFGLLFADTIFKLILSLDRH